MTDPKVEKWMSKAEDMINSDEQHAMQGLRTVLGPSREELIAEAYAPTQKAVQSLVDALEVLSDKEGAADGCDCFLFANNALENYRNATRGPDAVECDHNWVDATNEVITGGEVCPKCMAIRKSPTGGPDEQG